MQLKTSPLAYGSIGAIVTALIGAGIATAVFTAVTITTLTATNATITNVTSTNQTIGGTGAAKLDYVGFVTTSIDVASLAGYAATSQVVSTTGAVVGDASIVSIISGDLGGTTSSPRVIGKVTSADNTTLYFINTSSSVINYGANAIGITTISK